MDGKRVLGRTGETRVRKIHHSLVQFVSGRRAMLSTISTAPGLWIIIIAMLSAPTSFMRYVWMICGMYWIAASIAELTPSSVAQEESRGGRGWFGTGEGETVRR